MRRIAQIPSGPYSGSDGRVVCFDSHHDSLPELMFHTGTTNPSDPTRIEVWEHRGWNRFSLVFADTGIPASGHDDWESPSPSRPATLTEMA